LVSFPCFPPPLFGRQVPWTRPLWTPTVILVLRLLVGPVSLFSFLTFCQSPFPSLPLYPCGRARFRLLPQFPQPLLRTIFLLSPFVTLSAGLFPHDRQCPYQLSKPPSIFPRCPPASFGVSATIAPHPRTVLKELETPLLRQECSLFHPIPLPFQLPPPSPPLLSMGESLNFGPSFTF